MGDSSELVPGKYLVVAYTDEEHFHEVYRHIPVDIDDVPYALPHGFWKKLAPGEIELSPVAIYDQSVNQGMSRFEGSSNFVVGSATLPDVPEHHRRVPPFLIDNHETTLGEWKAWLKKVGFELGNKVKELAIPDDYPVTYVNWDKALAYAESIGKRLPDEIEHEFASTNGGTRQAPWGNDLGRIVDWEFGPIGSPEFDRTEINPSVAGLHSNVAEWTSSWLTAYPTKTFPRMNAAGSLTDLRIVRGGPASVIERNPDSNEIQNGPRTRIGMFHYSSKAGLGFRCGRSTRARLRPQDFVGILN